MTEDHHFNARPGVAFNPSRDSESHVTRQGVRKVSTLYDLTVIAEGHFDVVLPVILMPVDLQGFGLGEVKGEGEPIMYDQSMTADITVTGLTRLGALRKAAAHLDGLHLRAHPKFIRFMAWRSRPVAYRPRWGIGVSISMRFTYGFRRKEPIA